MAKRNVVAAYGFTGGVSGTLAAINASDVAGSASGVTLQDSDLAIVIDQDTKTFTPYTFNSTSGVTTVVPAVIAPANDSSGVTYGGTGRFEIVHFAPVESVVVKALSGSTQLTVNDERNLWLDPNGASRDVTMPLASSSTGQIRMMINTADAAGENINIESSGASVGTALPGEVALVLTDGNTTWKGGKLLPLNGPMYIDAVNKFVGLFDAKVPICEFHMQNDTNSNEIRVETTTASTALIRLKSTASEYYMAVRGDQDALIFTDYGNTKYPFGIMGDSVTVGTWGVAKVPADSAKCLVIATGTKGSAGVANTAYFYVISGEMWAADSGNTGSQLTTHGHKILLDAGDVIADKFDDPLFWSFTHETDVGPFTIREQVNYQKAFMLLEQLTGEKLIYREIIENDSTIDDRTKEQRIKEYIAEQSEVINEDTQQRVNEIEASQADALETVEVDEKYKSKEKETKYKLVDGEIKSFEVQKIKTKKVQKVVLKKYHRFCPDTGKFFKCPVPTYEEARAHIEATWSYADEIPEWKLNKALDYLDKVKKAKIK